MFIIQATDYNRTQVEQNPSSLLLKIVLPNTQTLQLITINIKTEAFLQKLFRNAWHQGLGFKDKES